MSLWTDSPTVFQRGSSEERPVVLASRPGRSCFSEARLLFHSHQYEMGLVPTGTQEMPSHRLGRISSAGWPKTCTPTPGRQGLHPPVASQKVTAKGLSKDLGKSLSLEFGIKLLFLVLLISPPHLSMPRALL